MDKQIRRPPAPENRDGKKVVAIRNLKKRTVPKADGRYIVFYERP